MSELQPAENPRRAETIARQAAEQLGLPPPSLVRLGSAGLYRSGDLALRVEAAGAGVQERHRILDVLRSAGIPVPHPVGAPLQVAGCTVTIWPWIENAGLAVDGKLLGGIVARLHALDEETLHPVIDVPSWQQLGLVQLDTELAIIRDDRLVRAPELNVLEATYERCKGWEERTRSALVLCHGDLHLNNALVTRAGPCIIDWDTLCFAPACWDHAMFTTLDLWGGPVGFYQSFARGYGRDFSSDRGCQDLAQLRLLAATVNLVLRARTDALANAELTRRLRYWVDDPSAPTWAAV